MGSKHLFVSFEPAIPAQVKTFPGREHTMQVADDGSHTRRA